MRLLVLAGALVALALLVSASLLSAQPAAQQDRAGEQPEFVVSDLRVQEFPARSYLYVQQETTLGELAQVIPAMFETVWEAITTGNVQIIGSPIFVYDGMTQAMDKPFKLQVGFPVADNAQADGDVKMRQLEKYRCATVLFSGRMMDVGNAYQKLFTELNEAGLQPAGGHREMHLYFESPESPNNIVLIQVGVK